MHDAMSINFLNENSRGLKCKNSNFRHIILAVFALFFTLYSCSEISEKNTSHEKKAASIVPVSQTALTVLGNVQDAGSPHIACTKDCCRDLFLDPDQNRKVVSLGLIDPVDQKNYIIDATPDLPEQMKLLNKYSGFSKKETPDAIFLTHAHIGHYTGLMYFGKEAMFAQSVPVFAMPRLKAYLEQNGPWSLLVENNNIALKELTNHAEIKLSSNLRITPFLVPHRDEYSETVGFTVTGPIKKVLFIPDIDKWEKWDINIIEAISGVDYALIDGTFYDGEEINNRDISEIPHPFIIESMAKFKDLPAEQKKKIYFIHLNHTNPALIKTSAQAQKIIDSGFNVAQMFDVFNL